ncbi:DUF4127 family protein [Paenibacillus tarimensis]
MKVVYLPLDERPCNLTYPQQLARMTGLEFRVPARDMLGCKKRPAIFNRVSQWLRRESADADCLIVSVDMLIYGGIVPSRIHRLSAVECVSRLGVLQLIKKQRPELRIYAYNLIMRVPSYNSSDEEPDYYEFYGERISTMGKLLDKEEQGEITGHEAGQLARLKQEVPVEVQHDFMARRRVNAAVNIQCIELVNRGIIDYLIIPLDDNARYGFSSREQRQLVYKTEELNLKDQVAIYPGADEIGCTLFAKAFCTIHNYTPEVFVRYSSSRGPFIIPKYEDRSLHESIKSHVTAMGAMIGDHSQEADLILMVNSPPVGQSDHAETSVPFQERHRSYFSEVNLREFVQAIRSYAGKGKTVALADVATCNGSDTALMKLLKKLNLIGELDAYAGWNTSGNTIGTALAHGLIESYYRSLGRGDRRLQAGRGFYYARLTEDWGYQAVVRRCVGERDVERLGGTYVDVSSIQDEIETIIYKELDYFITQNLMGTDDGRIKLKRVFVPWGRMFEIGVELTWEERPS